MAGATIAAGRSRKLPRIVPAHDLDKLFLYLRQAAGARLRRPGDVLRRPHQCTTLLSVALLVSTGVRVTELVSIRCQDIDLPGQSLRLLGKGRRERHVFVTNAWLTQFMDAYLEARSTLGLEHPQLLFNLRGRPLTAAAMRSRLLRATIEAGLSARVTPHMLRHTAATKLIEAGVDIRYIQRLLGHASLTTTEIYTHVSDGALRRVVADADVLRRPLKQR